MSSASTSSRDASAAPEGARVPSRATGSPRGVVRAATGVCGAAVRRRHYPHGRSAHTLPPVRRTALSCISRRYGTATVRRRSGTGRRSVSRAHGTGELVDERDLHAVLLVEL